MTTKPPYRPAMIAALATTHPAAVAEYDRVMALLTERTRDLMMWRSEYSTLINHPLLVAQRVQEAGTIPAGFTRGT